MKTAVSIPDALFQEAEALAAKDNISRSELYSRAMREYLAARKQESLQARMREALQRIDQTPDPAWEEAQRQALLRSEWK